MDDGVGTASADHLTKQLILDKDRIFREFPIDAPLWVGARCELSGDVVTTAHADKVDSGSLIRRQPFLHSHGGTKNYCLYSDNVSNVAYWINSRVAMTLDYATSPSGKTDAVLMENTAVTYASLRAAEITTTSGMQTLSIWVKPISCHYVGIYLYDILRDGVFQNINNGLTYLWGADDDLFAPYGKQYCGNGWWRLWVRFEHYNSDTPNWFDFRLYMGEHTGTTTNAPTLDYTLLVWQPQAVGSNHMRDPVITIDGNTVEYEQPENEWDTLNWSSTCGAVYCEIDIKSIAVSSIGNIAIGDNTIFKANIKTTGTEKLSNSDFSSGTTGWLAHASSLSVADYGGETDVLHVADNGSWSYAYQVVTGLTVGQDYVFKGLRRNDAADTSAYVCIWRGDRQPLAGGDTVNGSSLTASDNGLWVEFQFYFIATTTTYTIGLHSSSTYTAYYDWVSLKEVDRDNLSAALTDGTNTTPEEDIPANRIAKVGFAYGESKMRLNINGVWGTETTFTGTMGEVGGDIRLGVPVRELLVLSGTTYADMYSEVTDWMALEIAPGSGGTTIPNFALLIGEGIRYNVLDAFTNGETYYFTMTNAPSWLTIDNTGEFNGSPTAAAVVSNVTVTGYNSTGNATSNTFSISSYAKKEIDHTIVNGGAESGDMTGWTTELSGAEGFRAWPYAGSFAGSYAFHGGDNSAESLESQEIDVVAQGLTANNIDRGNCFIRLEWQQSSHAGSDKGSLGVRFLDATGGSIISELESYNYGIDAVSAVPWIKRVYRVAIPSNTRSMVIFMHALRGAGTANNAYFDDIHLFSEQMDN